MAGFFVRPRNQKLANGPDFTAVRPGADPNTTYLKIPRSLTPRRQRKILNAADMIVEPEKIR